MFTMFEFNWQKKRIERSRCRHYEHFWPYAVSCKPETQTSHRLCVLVHTLAKCVKVKLFPQVPGRII